MADSLSLESASLPSTSPPLFVNPVISVLALGITFFLAGILTGHYDRNITRGETSDHLRTTVSTWAIATFLLFGGLSATHLWSWNREDIAFVSGSVTAMAMWRYVFSSICNFLP